MNRTPPTLAEIQGRALDALRQHGAIADSVYTDGTIHRFRTEGDAPGETAGWYIVHADEWPRIVIGDWRSMGDERASIPLFDTSTPLTIEEIQERDKAWQRQKKEREAKQAKQRAEATRNAKHIAEKAQNANEDNSYLISKQIHAVSGLKTGIFQHPTTKANEKNVLAVPLKNVHGEVINCQKIFADGKKRFLYGAETRGAFFEIAGNKSKTMVCEGIATAISIYEATGNNVISCCNKNNIECVVTALVEAGKLDPSHTIIVADNDWLTAQKEYAKAKEKGKAGGKTEADFNPGTTGAQKAAKAIGCVWCNPVPDGLTLPNGKDASDVNDYFCAKLAEVGAEEGIPNPRDVALAAVRGRLLQVIAEPTEQAEQPAPPMQFIPFGDAVNLPIPPELIKGFVPATGIGYLYGPTGSYKTFIAMQMGFHVSEELPIAGHKVKKRPVYYLLLEGTSGLGKRTKALDLWRKNKGINITGTYMFWPKPFTITNTNEVDALINTILMAGHEGAFIIIDTQSKATENIDEKEGVDIQAVLKASGRICESVKGVVMLIAHTGKNEENGIAGSYKQKADVDFTLEVKKIQNTKLVKLVSDKVKENKDNQVITFETIIQEVGVDEDGDIVTSCVAVPIDNNNNYTKEKRLSTRLERALDILRNAMKENNTNKIYKEDWRKASYANSTRSNDESKRAEFNENKNALKELNIIDEKNDFFWIVSDSINPN